MDEQAYLNYQRIEKAITFINDHFMEQPSLNEIAKNINLSPFHFQRLFTEWAGVSPKKFLQYISVNHAKQLLGNKQISLFDATHNTGLSSTGRLHDLFVKIEGMTPGEYKNGGESLNINYGHQKTQFGNILVASTLKGICYMGFYNEGSSVFPELKTRFPNANFAQQTDKIQENVLQIFNQNWEYLNQVKLHLKGTDFQLKVWEALLKIPTANLTTYGAIAKEIKKPKAARAVGTAIRSNPVAFLVPCHRVIQSTGIFGGYMWGPTRKTAIIGWESSNSQILK